MKNITNDLVKIDTNLIVTDTCDPVNLTLLASTDLNRNENNKLLVPKKKLSQNPIRIAIDGEWDSSKKINLCYTVVIEDDPIERIVVFNEKF